jgi:membrane associated rhomboid family serine protease
VDPFTLAAVVVMIITVIVGWLKRFSYVQVLIVGLLVIFFIEFFDAQFGADLVVDEMSFRPVYLTQGQNIYTMFTYMFVHGSVAHVVFNILFLFLIGSQLEIRVGKPRFVTFYYVAGIAAVLTEAFILGLDSNALILGASGAIAGTMGAMLWLYPRERIPMFLGPIFLPRVSVALSVLVWLAVQLFLDLMPGMGGGVAYSAHLGGFVTGLALAAVLPKVAPKGKVERVDVESLRPLATTPMLQKDLELIGSETEPAVRQAWLEHFAKHATCPRCGSHLELKGNRLKCNRCGFEAQGK